MDKLGVIGGGTMGSALIQGIIQTGLLKPEQILVLEADAVRGGALKERIGIGLADSVAGIAQANRVILVAVKPLHIAQVLADLNPHVTEAHLIISIAAGTSLQFMADLVSQARLVRVMPNTPARIGKGVSAYCLGRGTTPADRELIEAVLGCAGQTLQVTEDKIDAVTALSGSGPAYVCYFIDAMINAGVMLGLPRKDAQVLAVETVIGAAELLKTSGEHPQQLMNEVTSPGGTTAVALFELEKAGFAGTVMNAVQASAKRSAEIAKSR